nr:probable serine/threonine-protein kinase clkA [Hydra vulgaris]
MTDTKNSKKDGKMETRDVVSVLTKHNNKTLSREKKLNQVLMKKFHKQVNKFKITPKISSHTIISNRSHPLRSSTRYVIMNSDRSKAKQNESNTDHLQSLFIIPEHFQINQREKKLSSDFTSTKSVFRNNIRGDLISEARLMFMPKKYNSPEDKTIINNRLLPNKRKKIGGIFVDNVYKDLVNGNAASLNLPTSKSYHQNTPQFFGKNFSGEVSHIPSLEKTFIANKNISRLKISNEKGNEKLSISENEDENLFSNVELNVIYGDRESKNKVISNMTKSPYNIKIWNFTNSKLSNVILSHNQNRNTGPSFRRNKSSISTTTYGEGGKTVTYTTETKNGKTKMTKTVSFEDDDDDDFWTNGKKKKKKYDTNMYDDDKQHDFLIDVNDYNGNKNVLDISDKALHSGKISNYNPKYKAKLQSKDMPDTMKTVSIDSFNKNKPNTTITANTSGSNAVIGGKNENNINYNYVDNGVNSMKFTPSSQSSISNPSEEKNAEIIPSPIISQSMGSTSSIVQPALLKPSGLVLNHYVTSSPINNLGFTSLEINKLGLTASPINNPGLTSSKMNNPGLTSLPINNPVLASSISPDFTSSTKYNPSVTFVKSPAFSEASMNNPAPVLEQNLPILNSNSLPHQQNQIFQSQIPYNQHDIPNVNSESQVISSVLHPCNEKPVYQNHVQPLEQLIQTQSQNTNQQPYTGHQGFVNSSCHTLDITKINLPNNIQPFLRNDKVKVDRVINLIEVSNTPKNKQSLSAKSSGLRVESTKNQRQNNKTYFDDGILTIEEESIAPNSNILLFKKLINNFENGNNHQAESDKLSGNKHQTESDKFSGNYNDKERFAVVKYHDRVFKEVNPPNIESSLSDIEYDKSSRSGNGINSSKREKNAKGRLKQADRLKRPLNRFETSVSLPITTKFMSQISFKNDFKMVKLKNSSLKHKGNETEGQENTFYKNGTRKTSKFHNLKQPITNKLILQMSRFKKSTLDTSRKHAIFSINKGDDIPRYTRFDNSKNSKRRNEQVPRYNSSKDLAKKFLSETMVKRGHVLMK